MEGLSGKIPDQITKNPEGHTHLFPGQETQVKINDETRKNKTAGRAGKVQEIKAETVMVNFGDEANPDLIEVSKDDLIVAPEYRHWTDLKP